MNPEARTLTFFETRSTMTWIEHPQTFDQLSAENQHVYALRVQIFFEQMMDHSHLFLQSHRHETEGETALLMNELSDLVSRYTSHWESHGKKLQHIASADLHHAHEQEQERERIVMEDVLTWVGFSQATLQQKIEHRAWHVNILPQQDARFHPLAPMQRYSIPEYVRQNLISEGILLAPQKRIAPTPPDTSWIFSSTTGEVF